MKQDLVIGCISGYGWDDVKYWCNSLDRSGFVGTKAMIVYNGSKQLVEKLESKDYKCICFDFNPQTEQYVFPINGPEIVVTRFFHQWLALEKIFNKDEHRFVVACDVKDVIFQSNPSHWLEQNMGSDRLLAASEGVPYKDEAWGHDNMLQAWGPFMQDHTKNNLIRNAGTLAGEYVTFKDFCMNIFLMCNGNPIHNPDQAAVNILLTLEPFKSITKLVNHSDAWAAQCGTVYDFNKPDLIEKTMWDRPELIQGDLYTRGTDGTDCLKFVLVHQYDRTPKLRDHFRAKYDDKE